MASVKFYLDTRSARKDGTFPLKLVVTHKKPFNISLGVYLLPEQWNANEKKIVGNVNCPLNFGNTLLNSYRYYFGVTVW